jgi:hypothetical protein
MTDLADAINRVCHKESYYWCFRHTRGRSRADAQEIEARIDLPLAEILRIRDVPGWRIARVDHDKEMLFLRRTQPLTDTALRSMFVEVLTLAHERSGKFHSWVHGADLPEWTDAD